MKTRKYMRPEDIGNGLMQSHLESWKDLTILLPAMSIHTGYAWRGQRNPDWTLEPTFDRLVRELGIEPSKAAAIAEKHLNNFKYSCRGRRGINPPQLETENDWWALGQHNGLVTPLLDWTTSPYVALYFAFIEKSDGSHQFRSIYGVFETDINKMSQSIKKEYSDTGRAPIIEFVKPFSDENPRLVNQGGLFTRSPFGIDIETWIRQYFRDETKSIIMLRLNIFDKDREDCLRTLNRMNINHLTLFPDLFGASRFANLELELPNY